MEEQPLYRAVLSQEAEEFARGEVEDVHAG
jgi:hypothetical protein